MVLDDSRKAAYRKMLYHFLVTIRTIPLPLPNHVQAAKIGEYAGPVAYLLHNLALASVTNFVDFDEVQFWQSVSAFNKHNPRMPLLHIRLQFEQDLLAS
ncbi:MAG: hypothetical protein EOO36_16195 [Cytophagaceae bacterium]|nr:MAG: hypothetical protein EOO36_16195 [Cytophagaceae bacterium]